MIEAISGPDTADPNGLPTPTGSYRDAVESAPDLADLRIGYSPDFGDFVVSKSVSETVESALDDLSAAGATVEEVEIPSKEVGRSVTTRSSGSSSLDTWGYMRISSRIPTSIC